MKDYILCIYLIICKDDDRLTVKTPFKEGVKLEVETDGQTDRKALADKPTGRLGNQHYNTIIPVNQLVASNELRLSYLASLRT
jgi:hypothetical protein